MVSNGIVIGSLLQGHKGAPTLPTNPIVAAPHLVNARGVDTIDGAVLL